MLAQMYIFCACVSILACGKFVVECLAEYVFELWPLKERVCIIQYLDL